jgi:hypothetical protein
MVKSTKPKKGQQAAKDSKKGALKGSKKPQKLVAEPETNQKDLTLPEEPEANVNNLTDDQAVAAVHQLVRKGNFDELNCHLLPSEKNALLQYPPVWPDLSPIYSPYACSSARYTQIRFQGKKYSAHRLTARCFHGQVPAKADVSHILVMDPVKVEGRVFDMSSNINPKHLVYESNQTNQHRRACAAVFKKLAQWRSDNASRSPEEIERHCELSLYGCRHFLHQEHPCRSYGFGLSL